MKIKRFKKLICILIIFALIFSVPTAYAADSSDPPAGYVITDGTSCYWIDFNELFVSYLSYRLNQNSDEGKLAKFYFDTLGDDPMSHLVSYVSGVTTKFVSYSAIFMQYLVTRDVDATYIWFNSPDPANATPAFNVITQVMVLGPQGTVTGSVLVGTDGYIITLPSQGIIIPGIVRMTIDAGETDAYLNLYNPSGNACCFIITLKLDDGTVLYESDLLMPGETVGDATLTQALAYGEYDASVLFEAFDPDDLSPLNSAEVIITLIAN